MIINNIEINTIRSGKGDCIHLRFIGDSGSPRNIIIDTGPTSTSGEFRKLYEAIVNKDGFIDYLFITHYDDDHIGGVLKLAMSNLNLIIKQAVFNAFRGEEPTPFLTATQNQRLFHALIKTDIECIGAVKDDVISLDGAKITIIAPTKERIASAMKEMEKADTTFLSAARDWDMSLEALMKAPYPGSDTSISNKASIAFIFEYCGARMLFCGDAPADCLVDGLQKLDSKFDFIKLPHHGSIRNISEELLKTVKSDTFLICADGKSHPDKQTIAKLLSEYGHINIIGNYEWWEQMLLPDEDSKYKDDLIFRLNDQ